jgi:hypothetical protein
MATYERIDYGSDDGSQWGGAASDKLGCYGKVPVVQRPYSSAVHATSGLVTSAGSLFVASHLAAIQEIQLTLIGLGVWATA